jgi:O-6-methylguanine DNA methyltransferase
VGQIGFWKYTAIEVPEGPITIIFNEQGIYSILLGRQKNFLHEGNHFQAKIESRLPWPALEGELQNYFRGKPIQGAYPLLTEGYTAWTLKVLQHAQAIPFGETRSYKQLAIMVGSPAGARAVGQALGRNRTPILIPCHRIIGQNGALTGFGCGLDWKRALLKIEGHQLEAGIFADKL